MVTNKIITWVTEEIRQQFHPADLVADKCVCSVSVMLMLVEVLCIFISVVWWIVRISFWRRQGPEGEGGKTSKMSRSWMWLNFSPRKCYILVHLHTLWTVCNWRYVHRCKYRKCMKIFSDPAGEIYPCHPGYLPVSSERLGCLCHAAAATRVSHQDLLHRLLSVRSVVTVASRRPNAVVEVTPVLAVVVAVHSCQFAATMLLQARRTGSRLENVEAVKA